MKYLPTLLAMTAALLAPVLLVQAYILLTREPWRQAHDEYMAAEYPDWIRQIEDQLSDRSIDA